MVQYMAEDVAVRQLYKTVRLDEDEGRGGFIDEARDEMRHDRYLERLDITPRAEVGHMPAHEELAQYSPTEARAALSSLLSILTFDNDR